MGIFDFLFRSRSSVLDGAALRDLLFRASGAGDRDQLEQLCRAHREAIERHFPEWQQVPAEVRTQPTAMQHYAQGLIAVAQVFADRLAVPDLLRRLMGSPESNPIERWRERLGQAQKLMDELGYSEARKLLDELLTDVRKLRGSAADLYLPITLGRLGECYFQGGKAEKAVAPFEQALELCVGSGDAEGVVAYLGNLYEAHRYLDQRGPAADYGLELADALDRLGRTEEASRYRKQAALVRRGEPLNRVVAVVDGRQLELCDLSLVGEQKVGFVFARNRITLRPAAALTRRGNEHGSAGRFDAALEAFRAAAAADPFDPDPRYQQGFTLLRLRRYAEGMSSYRATEELAPGWFHCRADLWLAERLALGELGHETLLALEVLEDGAEPAEQKVHLAQQALAVAPRVALLHLLRGNNLAQLGRRPHAQAAYRDGLACSPEPDVKTRLLVQLAIHSDDPHQQIRLYREAEALGGNLVASATATLALRALSRT